MSSLDPNIPSDNIELFINDSDGIPNPEVVIRSVEGILEFIKPRAGIDGDWNWHSQAYSLSYEKSIGNELLIDSVFIPRSFTCISIT